MVTRKIMGRYTPGPWEAKWDEYGYLGIYDRSGECIAEMTEREDEANARLIASAPELVDELCNLLDYMSYVPAYQCYKGPNETWDEAIRAHEDVERVKALLNRIYGEEDEQ